MSRWKELPDSLDDPGRQLIVQLRRLKDRSGLSLASLQSKTGYSRSSWERYLNGKALPPRQAVEELARVADVEPTRILVLHEVAEEARQKDDRAAEAAEVPAPKGVRRWVLIGLLATVVLGALLVGLLLTTPWAGDSGGGKTLTGSQPSAAVSPGPGAPFAYRPGKTYPCAVKRENGRLYAGYSTTRTAVLSQPGWDVVEAQCLLHHLGFDPGGADGVYGENTTRAVKRLQDKAGLPPDGIVGPHTWQVLRR
ncbi:peptidoglycan-binding protein [Streptomyces gibsoniae]|uniref:Peptidoglycan-binding protein n=1 Tax=Streptomyces gibsoniae TaxID=3075529 RepID=A0ABU2U3J7_9ACTN|nr:peptidoglycan-binding protein [Streptomyces sp. DSM 41699]MDT0467739.1 peptidoglycan-binding protein [Streptomyces sp. DSM 41699]